MVKTDLKRIRNKWNHNFVNASLWGSDVDVVENPVMWNFVISSGQELDDSFAQNT